jgi:hypothetical protein
MKYQEITALLEKYWEAETSLSEEKALKTYFNGNDVDARLEEFRPYFAAVKAEKSIEMTKSIHRTLLFERPKWIRYAAAASIVFLLGFGSWWYVGYQTNQQKLYTDAKNAALQTDTFEDPEKAAAEVMAALKLVSRKLNKGKKAAAKGLNKIESVDKYILKPKSKKNS